MEFVEFQGIGGMSGGCMNMFTFFLCVCVCVCELYEDAKTFGEL